MKYALTDTENTVVNVVSWDGDTSRWTPPVGTTAHLVPDVWPGEKGDTYDGTTLTKRPPTDAELAAQALGISVDQLRAAKARLVQIRDAPAPTISNDAQARTAILQLWDAVNDLGGYLLEAGKVIVSDPSEG